MHIHAHQLSGLWGGILLALVSAPLGHGAPALPLTYVVVDTGQDRCFDTGSETAYPQPGTPFFGQDAHYQGRDPSYRDNTNGTVTDLNTGLMWQKVPDLTNKSTFAQAAANAKSCRLAGYTDWRLPTIKELYSLIDFRGYSARTKERSRPYIDTGFFAFAWGDETRGERLIDAQFWSSTEYQGRTMQGLPTAFGVNFADGRIKGYPLKSPRGETRHFVRYVRDSPEYGRNDFADNGDGTVTDRATGLMWQKADSGKGMPWQAALTYAESLDLAGHTDWRLPNAKELQSIVDYTRAPDAPDAAHRGSAISPLFSVTDAEAWYWTGTTHLEGRACAFAVYLCFGQAMGSMHGTKMNVHGAGAQRSDPKAGDPALWRDGNGPQGDEVRILNAARCVRGGDIKPRLSGPPVSGLFTGGNGPQQQGRPMGGPPERRRPDGPPPPRLEQPRRPPIPLHPAETDLDRRPRPAAPPAR